MSNNSKAFERLPKTVVPEHYTITLKPDLETFAFDGVASIRVKVVEATKSIVLNAAKLTIGNVTLTKNADGNSSALKPTSISMSTVPDTTAMFEFQDVLNPGLYDLDIIYVGEISSGLNGLYRSKYVDTSGVEKVNAVTQFEAIDARKCFPCWDEPSFKATFDIILQVASGLVAVSNMPVKSVAEIENGRTQFIFDTTPKMSTYLVALIIGDYKYQETQLDKVSIRVYAQPDKLPQTSFAVEITPKVLAFYNNYFNIPYPLPKADLAALADFGSGAMENWGLITYRETCLLMDPDSPTASRKQCIAIVIAHEFAHQWFGNLVTMDWWTDLWLNEGFATFMEFLCVDNLFPDFKVWNQFINNTHNQALELDALKNSHPIEVPIGHPDEIDEIFDDISYSKGASIIFMLYNYIGDKDFRDGVHYYLKKHQYANTNTEDLWSALEQTSGKPIKEVMGTWTKYVGFPVISASLKSVGEGKFKLKLSQKRFLADGSAPDDTLWLIPVQIITTNSPTKPEYTVVLRNKEEEFDIDNLALDGWVKINAGTGGFYRTAYNSETLSRLLLAIEKKQLPALDRLGLLDDLMANVLAGHNETKQLLLLLNALKDEDEYTVWTCICGCLSKLTVILAGTQAYESFAKFARLLLSGVGKKIGVLAKPDESHSTTLLRSLVLSYLVWFDDRDTIDALSQLFHMKEQRPIHGDLKLSVYRAAMRGNSSETLKELTALYKTTNLQEERDRIAATFGYIKGRDLITEAIDFTWSDAVRSQDKPHDLVQMSRSKVGRELVWNFIKSHWSQLVKMYRGQFLLTNLIKSVASNLSVESEIADMEKFFRENTTPGIERTTQQAIESAHLNRAWLSRDYIHIQEFFDSY